MRLIKFTNITGNPIWIAPSKVQSVHPHPQGTIIDFGGEDTTVVTESSDDVLTELNSRLDP